MPNRDYLEMPTRDYLDRLRSVTQGCRPDMHEPDEQGVTATVSGDHLDNAMGDDPAHSHGEFIVTIAREESHGTVIEHFNLASLIALARRADRGSLPHGNS